MIPLGEFTAGDRVRIELALANLIDTVSQITISKGFRAPGERRPTGEVIALMHSELSEALENFRKPGPDNHLPEYPGWLVEYADVLIRIFDHVQEMGEASNLASVLMNKIAYNANRPYKHGKKF